MIQASGSESELSTGRGDPRRAILVALMMTMALAAMDQTVVTTAVPSIVHNLGDLSLFPWLFAIYVLTQAVTIPIYGRLADLFGRKIVLCAGIGVFVLASVLCAVAPNMVFLIVFRGLQGIGAGAIAPMVLTIAGDLYSVRERARVQGYIASVWAVSSVVGPLVGGSFSEYVNWRWIFYINIPLGAAALLMLQRRLHENIAKKAHTIDYLGGSILTAGLAILIFGLLQGGVQWAWTSPKEIVVLLGGSVLITAFGFVERRALEPMVPLWVLARRPLVAGSIANIAIGAVQIGLISYVPTYMQGVRGFSPIVAGLTVASLTVGWPLASSFAGRLYLRFGFRTTGLIGAVISLVGSLLFSTLNRSTPVLLVALFGFITGFGIGFIAMPVLVALQSLVSWNRRGIVTATNLFSRSLGGALGVAVLGSVANSSLATWLSHPPATVSGQLPHTINAVSQVLGGHDSGLSAAATSYVRSGLFQAVHAVFLGIFISGLLTLIAVMGIPKKLVPLVFGDDPDETPGEADREGVKGVEPVLG